MASTQTLITKVFLGERATLRPTASLYQYGIGDVARLTLALVVRRIAVVDGVRGSTVRIVQGDTPEMKELHICVPGYAGKLDLLLGPIQAQVRGVAETEASQDF